MREILFRAKHYRTKQWVHGIPFKNPLRGSEDAYYPQIIPEVHGVHSTINSCSIIEETIGQFTGLTDKNGTKIFNGDILQGDEYPYCSDGDYNYYAEVVWFDNGCCGFGLCTHKNPKSAVRGISDGNCEWFEDFDSNNWLVVGNIYDNPELIGGSENG